ncbi:MAG: glucose-6-phosphate dehydrogenase [Propionibacteriaceae bacterium]|nr:glucose-6-phosphate dehydrogenase [Propionibacteriaceae bacterium]
MSAEPVTLAILGASGDLTHRLLLPGLGTLLRAHPGLQVDLVGAAYDDLGEDAWRERVGEALVDGGCRSEQARALASTTRFRQLDVTDAEAMRAFLAELDGAGHAIVLYFALPPAVTQRAIGVLQGLDVPPGLRLAIEKPFGTGLHSAQELNDLLTSVVPEQQIFRVDHYLGKATVLNLLGLRFGNRIFEPVWNAVNIERVEIIADEALALEGRAGYYDGAGALKDMIQSHLLLVTALFALEEPASMDELELRDLIVHALRAMHLWEDDPTQSRRARYTEGQIDGRTVPDYTSEEGVDPDRKTETLAEVTVEIRNSRWAGVPFRLRSGKALGSGFRGIVVKFRPVAHLPSGFRNEAAPNMMVIGIAPETIALGIATNGEGSRWDFEQTTLSANLSESPVRPYGEILDGILSGDPLLSVRGDATEELWRILDPVFEAWSDGRVPLDEYTAGSYGPTAWN